MQRSMMMQCGSEELAVSIHYPVISGETPPERYPLIIICHGFAGNRIGVNRLYVKAAQTFSRHGYLVIRFDFAGCGESSGDYGEHGLDSMVDQTRSVLDYAMGMECIDPNRVVLLGHSLGGTVALLTATVDKRVRKLILWSPVANPFTDIVNMAGKKVYEASVTEGAADYMGYRLPAAYFESLTKHHPFQEARKFTGDVLLIHGTSDEAIPVDYSYLLQKVFWSRQEGQCDLDVLFQADHAFTSGNMSAEAIRKSLDWLDRLEKQKQNWDGWII
jgi:hypothetical protein